MSRACCTAFALLFGACSFDGSAPGTASISSDADTSDASSNDGNAGDASDAIPSDGGYDCNAWTPAHFTACLLPAPEDPLILDMAGSPWRYDTTTGTLRNGSLIPSTPANLIVNQANGTQIRILSTTSFGLEEGANLRVFGSMGFVIAATADITIAGVLDGTSRRLELPGPGASPELCKSAGPAVTGTAGNSGSGGGGGGAFQGQGAPGGDADSNSAAIKPGGAGGQVHAVPTLVHGGCPGAISGTGNSQNAPGGEGGGAIQLSAFGTITVSGTVAAGGSGGTGGPQSTACGGGGGGAGGYIGLEADTVQTSGSVLAANGGGGGEGTDLSTSAQNGLDGIPGNTAAAGGSDPSCGSRGGDGSAAGLLVGGNAGNVDSCGGGGGGGGAGYVLIHTPNHQDGSSVISPAAIVTSP